MVRKLRKPILFCLVILLVLVSSSCSRKPPIESSGYCSEIGQTRYLDETFEVCLQKGADLAWFSEGSEIEMLIAVGRSVARIEANNSDVWEALLNKLNLVTEADKALVWDNLISTDLLAKAISKVSADDQRWDDLQVSLGKFQSAEANWKLAIDDWSQLAIREIKDKGSVTFEERRRVNKIMNDAADKMENIFDYEVAPNLKPFISSKLSEIGIQNETTAVKLTFAYLKYLGK